MLNSTMETAFLKERLYGGTPLDTTEKHKIVYEDSLPFFHVAYPNKRNG